MSAEEILRQRQFFRTGYEYGYGSGGTTDSDSDGKKEIDCSHLVNSLLVGAGYRIPYETTSGLSNSRYYETIAAKDVKAGDLILWQSTQKHVGIVEEITVDAAGGAKGKFFGSQSSTGPASAAFGPGKYWKDPTKFLRPKQEYFHGAGSARSVHPIAAPPPPPTPPSEDAPSTPEPQAATVAPPPAPTRQVMLQEAAISTEQARAGWAIPVSQDEGVNDGYAVGIPMDSGLFPIGENLTWHGGVHEVGDPSKPILCMFDGVVVAARLPERDPSKPAFGSRNFVLIKHKTPQGDSFWSLYMHLLPILLKSDDQAMVDAMPWLYEMELSAAGSDPVKFRPLPSTQANFEPPRLVQAGEVFTIIDQRDVEERRWYQVVSKLDRTTGWIAKTNRITITSRVLGLDDLKAGKVVKFDHPIQAGTCIGFMSHPDPAKQPFAHLEIFSEKLLPGGWMEVADSDENDVVCDAEGLKEILNKFGDAIFLDELTKDTVCAAYANDEIRAKMWTRAYRFKSEWAVDWKDALKRYDPSVAEQQGPEFNKYGFWCDAEAAGCDLPKGGMVFHYQPRVFKHIMFPPPQRTTLQNTVDPEKQVSFYVVRNGEKVDVSSPADLEETEIKQHIKVYSKHDDQFLGFAQNYVGSQGICFSKGDNLYRMLIKNGGTSVPPGMSMRARRIWASIHHSEGSLDGINSYDAAFLSMGAIQQTCGRNSSPGELAAGLNAVKLGNPTLYQRLLGDFGIEPDSVDDKQPGVQTGHISIHGVKLDSTSLKARLREFWIAYRIRDALRDTMFQNLFYSYGFKRLDLIEDLKRTENGKTYRFKDIYKTELAAALVLDAHINLPTLGNSVWWNAAKSVCSLQKLEAGEVSQDQELAMIKEILALRISNRPKMTSPAFRAAFVLLCIKDLSDSIAKELGFRDVAAIGIDGGLPTARQIDGFKLDFLEISR